MYAQRIYQIVNYLRSRSHFGRGEAYFLCPRPKSRQARHLTPPGSAFGRGRAFFLCLRPRARQTGFPAQHMESGFGFSFYISHKRGMIIRHDILYNYKKKQMNSHHSHSSPFRSEEEKISWQHALNVVMRSRITQSSAVTAVHR
jgi:hypothetical protein